MAQRSATRPLSIGTGREIGAVIADIGNSMGRLASSSVNGLSNISRPQELTNHEHRCYLRPTLIKG